MTPEEIVAQAMQKRRDPKFMAAGIPPSAICRGEAITAVTALREAGYRIVRQEQISGDEHDRNCSEVLFGRKCDCGTLTAWVDVEDGTE